MRLPDAMSDPGELLEFSRIELAILDLDGTLLADSADVPDQAVWDMRRHLINRLKGRGVPLTLATGRAAAGAFPIIDAISRSRDLPVIIYNGSVVLTASRTVLSLTSLPFRALASIKECVISVGASALLYWVSQGFDGMLAGEWAVYEGIGAPPEREFNGLPISDYSVLPKNASCVAALVWSEDESAREAAYSQLCNFSGISVTSSGAKFIEVRPAGSSKAKGLEVLLASMGISVARVLAIGDNDNDVELLHAVGLGVCVSNASAGARAASRYCADYPSSSGAIQTLQVVARAKRLFS